MVTILFFYPAFAAAPKQWQQCISIKDDSLRLACYDKTAKISHQVDQKNHYTPPDKFLNAELRVDKHVSEYRLRVSDFLALIKAAVMDNQKKIEILGWEKKHHYELHIRMRQPVSLQFEHIDAKTENFCVLKPVLVDGEIIDPAIFILNIASMSPDDEQ
ncbi:MAG: hypothetical protein ACC707_09940 [Thiohalomonadales bacterium]